MAKFTLPPTGLPFDAGKTITVDIPDSAPARKAFAFGFEADSFLPRPSVPARLNSGSLFDDGPLSPAAKAMKINFVSEAARKDSAGLGELGNYTPEYDFPNFELAKFTRKSSFDDVGLGDSPVENEQDAPFTKGAAAEFHKFSTFTKVQETSDGNVLVWGVATHQQPDLDGEMCHYDTAKEAYQAWSGAAKARTEGAGQEVSLGNVRHQHTPEPAGKVTKIEYDDANKAIWLGSIPISDDIRRELQQGFLTGYSQGGSYAWRKCADCGKGLGLQQANNYCPSCKTNVPVLYGLKRLSEVSYVDSPCTGQGFDYVKRDGTSRFVTFAKRADRESVAGFKILSTVRISPKISKVTALVDGRKRTIVVWPEGHLVV